MAARQLEIEMRARLGASSARVRRAILALPGVRTLGTTTEGDRYMKHRSDKRRRLIFRLRRRGGMAVFTLKAQARGNDTAWADVDIPVRNPDHIEELLLENDYVVVVDIRKQRSTYRWRSFEINIDVIRGLGSFVEIEGRGTTARRLQIERDITNLLKRLERISIIAFEPREVIS